MLLALVVHRRFCGPSDGPIIRFLAADLQVTGVAVGPIAGVADRRSLKAPRSLQE
jgi:hypothetical protein